LIALPKGTTHIKTPNKPMLDVTTKLRFLIAAKIGVSRYEKIHNGTLRLLMALDVPPMPLVYQLRRNDEIPYGVVLRVVVVLDQAGRMSCCPVVAGSPIQERRQLRPLDYPVKRKYHTGFQKLLRCLPFSLWLLFFWRRLSSRFQSAKSGEIVLDKIQCSARRIDENTVLLSCGEAFLKTDNKGVSDMITALTRLLTGDKSCQFAAEPEPSQTNPRLDILPEKFADATAPVPTPPLPSCQKETQNKFLSRRPQNVVTLFSVTSYKRG
jgi:hypothetical protein